MSLRRRFAQSSAWLIAGTSTDNIIQFIIFAILARILPIRDFGIVAFTMLFVDISRIFVTGGLPASLVQARDWNDHVSSVCFTYNAAMAVAFGLLFAVVGGPLFEHFYGAGSGWIVASLGLVFFIDSIKAVHVAKLRREMRYRSLAVRGSVAGIAGGAIAIGIALAGGGAWALVFQRLIYQLVLAWLSLNATRWWPKLVVDRQVLRQLMPFGLRVTISRGLDMINLRMPNILIGFVAGPVGVALYRVGTRALDTLRRIFLFPFQDAAFSALSRIQARPAIAAAYLRLNRAVATVAFPVFFGLTAVATDVTTLFFGEKYAASGDIFAVLALAGVPNTLALFAGSAFLAAGQPRMGNITNATLLLFNLVLIVPLTYRFGSVGAAIGNLVAMLLVMPLTLHLLKRHLDLHVADLLRAIAAPTILSALMAAALWGIKLYLQWPMPRLIEVAFLVAAGAVLYVGMFALWGRAHLRELLIDLEPLFPESVGRRLAALSGRLS
ncbi:oligosaccharide flippase family protein [Sphingomonas sp. URHD0057]|uniref:oligosaccharide flippase family protein n=1 Tax=Sphingomonas sp. URHD0057 TaxID=1380389 RepID=UPI00048D8E78|nr:oligosaccharide flippase family protein [Sphingomonas sp. URHD0057]